MKGKVLFVGLMAFVCSCQQQPKRVEPRHEPMRREERPVREQQREERHDSCQQRGGGCCEAAKPAVAK